ncbi:signal recognition particle protein [Phlyctema vagabunda]|uniref:Signal recognition particle subunit SRP68 n=1 Tax=Phlyctema vagabunda TaxID=108571 RepID=A0ABR4P4P7_9HELO
MDITKFIVTGRDQALLYGDYSTYRSQLSGRIHNLRKRLGIATKPRAKYTPKPPVTAADIGSNHEYVHLLLLTSERAWANAMTMKSVHSVETKGITGSARSHIISRLHKATTYADELFRLLGDRETTGATDVDVIEVRAYAASLTGAVAFEKQDWEKCVQSYSEARILYSALETSTKSDTFKDLLSATVDPSIRYSAYQMRLPRTIAVPVIARKYFPRSDGALVAQIEKLDPDALKDQATKNKEESTDSGAAPKTITWRSRQVDLEDAAIATALAAVNTASVKLAEVLSSGSLQQSRDKASAYDDVLIASQDAVDATKHAIDELTGEGVGQGDKRMQSLQITRTAVSYDMVSWRIGRNRVLAGERDGAILGSNSASKKRKNDQEAPNKEESTAKKLAHLQEKVVLYDGIMQSLDSIKELPGVAADSDFVEELDAKYGYFQALKCLTIARSHAILSAPQNALALLARAVQLSTKAQGQFSSQMETDDSTTPPNITITSTSSQYLYKLLLSELQHYRALVELANLDSAAATKARAALESKPFLIDNLNLYPEAGADLHRIVNYPPSIEPVPVKPLFFDAAWNYIEYPGREIEQVRPTVGGQADGAGKKGVDATAAAAGQQKKGWFGFGR